MSRVTERIGTKTKVIPGGKEFQPPKRASMKGRTYGRKAHRNLRAAQARATAEHAAAVARRGGEGV